MRSLPVSPPAGEPSLPELFEAIYGRLKELSSMFMRSQPMGHTLQPTAVVNEAFIKLAERDAGSFVSEEHFFATAATVLRSVLVDHARRRSSKKRGAGKRGASMGIFDFDPADRSSDVTGLLELEDALQALAEIDARAAHVAELRIYGAVSLDHLARLLGTSVPTVERDWRFARAFLEKQYGVTAKGRRSS
ncbi:MAG: sigma-70 family RNA polymerase sigma factor [Planctomycetes bacterium]|nr:sigma-70 family RNA polymerase sigma factor [Planctomycetota bacterium]